MKKIIAHLMDQKLLVGLLIALVAMTGITVAKKINREAFPEVNFDMVSIRTVYPGGAPDDLEQLVTIPIEKKLRKVDGIDKVRSYNIENVSVVVAYLDDHVRDHKRVVQNIRDAVELVENLPAEVSEPIIEEITTDTTPAIDIAVCGKTGEEPYGVIREAANDLEDFLYTVKGVSEVEMFGFDDREFLIEVNPDSLRRFRIGMNTVIRTLQNRNIDLPGGSLRVGDTEYVLRTKGQFKNAEEIRNTVIMSNDAGFVTRVRDVATVADTYREPDVHERFNGKPSVVLRVWRQSSADEIRLVNRLKSDLASYRPANGAEVALTVFNDMSRWTRDSIERVLNNALVGFILLALILLVLLGWRMSGIVTMSIPIVFMVSIIAMKVFDITFNVISLFGMVMVLGMIVDFGIVVTENSHRYMERGMCKRDAIVKGVSEVFGPTLVTLMCLCAAFSPLLFLSGLMGKFILGIPVVLIICLAASWVIAMFVMPTLLNMFAREESSLEVHCETEGEVTYEPGRFGRFQHRYRRMLDWTLRHRYVTILVLVVLFAASLALTSVIGFMFNPQGGEEEITMRTTMPQETNLQANLREMRTIEGIIGKLPKSILDNYRCTVGKRVTDALDPAPGEATHKSTFKIYLTPNTGRTRQADDILVDVRRSVAAAQKDGTLASNIMIEYEVERNGPPIGKPVNVEIRGKDFATLKRIASEYIDYLGGVAGVQDIRLDLEDGKKEYRFVTDEVIAARSGISVSDVAQSINASFEGAIASSVTRDEEEVNLRVRFPEWARKRMTSLNDVMIANASGGLIPLGMVARSVTQPGLTEINRLDYQRVVQVQANVDTSKITSIQVNKQLAAMFHDIERRYPGYTVAYGGEQEETEERMGELGVLFVFALMIIFIMLAVYFGSLTIPVVVMIAIPFALVGMIFALWAHGQPMSFMSMLGFFSLAGVIVSNTLVLVEFINLMRDSGLPLKEALLEAGVIRLRPIILTAGTTVLGLVPSIYGIGGKDYMVGPLALSFGYGLVFATVITLVLVPVFYHIAEDIKGFTAGALSLFGIQMKREIYSSKDGAQS